MPFTEFIIYRILGNDLPPRSSLGQTLKNLQFTLEHEDDFPDVQKKWIVNRILDPAQESAILELLEKHERPYLHMPFSAEDYANEVCNIQGLPEELSPFSIDFHSWGNREQYLSMEFSFRNKIRYLCNVNAARNLALADGKERARWVAPWDSGCFLREETLNSLRASSSNPNARYLITLLARTKSYDEIIAAEFNIEMFDEPQITFRNDSVERFNETLRYGYSNKAEMLRRLQVRGPWDRGGTHSWDYQARVVSPEAKCYAHAGWVARMPSNSDDSDLKSSMRTPQRRSGIIGICETADKALVEQNWTPERAFLLAMPERVTEDVASMLCDFVAQVGNGRGAKATPYNTFLLGIAMLLEALSRKEPQPGEGIKDVVDSFQAQVTPQLLEVLLSSSIEKSGFASLKLLMLIGLLDAIRLMRHLNTGASQDVEKLDKIESICRSSLLALKANRRFRRASAGTYPHSSCYELLTAVLSAYLGDLDVLSRSLHRAKLLLNSQYHADGSPVLPYPELHTFSISLENALIWITFERLSRSYGQSLFTTSGSAGLLDRMLTWLEMELQEKMELEQVGNRTFETFLTLLALAPGSYKSKVYDSVLTREHCRELSWRSPLHLGILSRDLSRLKA